MLIMRDAESAGFYRLRQCDLYDHFPDMPYGWDASTGPQWLRDNGKEIIRLARAFTTANDILVLLGVERDDERLYIQTYALFWDLMERGYAEGALKIRRAQLALAEEGDTAMLKHLGVNYLNQVSTNNNLAVLQKQLALANTNIKDVNEVSEDVSTKEGIVINVIHSDS